MAKPASRQTSAPRCRPKKSVSKSTKTLSKPNFLISELVAYLSAISTTHVEEVLPKARHIAALCVCAHAPWMCRLRSHSDGCQKWHRSVLPSSLGPTSQAVACPVATSFSTVTAQLRTRLWMVWSLKRKCHSSLLRLLRGLLDDLCTAATLNDADNSGTCSQNSN